MSQAGPSSAAAGTRSPGNAATPSPANAGTLSPGNAVVSGREKCKAATLAMTVDDRQAGAAAGSTYYPVDFTNTSSVACTMTGYPGVSLVTATNGAGQQIGAAAQRNPAFGATVVYLAAGGHAHAWLQVAAAGNYPASTCRPTAAYGLRVYPPDQTAAGYVQHGFPACAADSAPLLTVMPVRPGIAAQGNTP